jgi:hypothetical protein
MEGTWLVVNVSLNRVPGVQAGHEVDESEGCRRGLSLIGGALGLVG